MLTLGFESECDLGSDKFMKALSEVICNAPCILAIVFTIYEWTGLKDSIAMALRLNKTLIHFEIKENDYNEELAPDLLKVVMDNTSLMSLFESNHQLQFLGTQSFPERELNRALLINKLDIPNNVKFKLKLLICCCEDSGSFLASLLTNFIIVSAENEKQDSISRTQWAACGLLSWLGNKDLYGTSFIKDEEENMILSIMWMIVRRIPPSRDYVSKNKRKNNL